ncbi:preprotein translocase subunit SecG [Aquimarina hainanensis]|uniref:Protein-export membrane protein SecG n=1 Tax=Aquimarina hainanensis TaxID=1578017 RepID=A0ABW5N627_9FLAO|nr:preprotein translocase subunit SecG [Aquimarina sp. TRL1]QKX04240.1 preprotein translocase subunit SecG [Aquimarina sp. TRL1]
MTTFSIFLILIVIVSFLLVVVIMVQNPKGGGLSSSFGGGGTQQLGGVKKTTDFLDKSTWALATLLLVLILLSNIDLMNGSSVPESKVDTENVQLETPQTPSTEENNAE